MKDNLKELATMAKLVEVLGQAVLLKIASSDTDINFDKDPLAPFTFVRSVLGELEERWKNSPEFASMQGLRNNPRKDV